MDHHMVDAVLANVTIRRDDVTWGTNCVPEHLKG